MGSTMLCDRGEVADNPGDRDSLKCEETSSLRHDGMKDHSVPQQKLLEMKNAVDHEKVDLKNCTIDEHDREEVSDDSDAPPDYMISLKLPSVSHDGVENNYISQKTMLDTKMNSISKGKSFWIFVLTALLFMAAITCFVGYLWWNQQQLELKQHKTATEVQKQHTAREKFFSELTELAAEQDEAHRKSLAELEIKIQEGHKLMAEQEKMYNSSFLELEKKIEEAQEVMAEQEKTQKSSLVELENMIMEAHEVIAEQRQNHQNSLKKLEKKLQPVLATHGTNLATLRSGARSHAFSSLVRRLAQLVLPFATLMLWQHQH